MCMFLDSLWCLLEIIGCDELQSQMEFTTLALKFVVPSSVYIHTELNKKQEHLHICLSGTQLG